MGETTLIKGALPYSSMRVVWMFLFMTNEEVLQNMNEEKSLVKRKVKCELKKQIKNFR